MGFILSILDRFSSNFVKFISGRGGLKILSNKYRVMGLGFALVLKHSSQSLSSRYSVHLYLYFNDVADVNEPINIIPEKGSIRNLGGIRQL